MSIGSTSVLAVALACAPITAALAQTAQTPQTTRTTSTQTQTQGTANQTQGTTSTARQFVPGRLVVPVTGTVGAVAEQPAANGQEESGDGTVTGTFAIQRFARTTEGGLAAVGTLTLTLTDQATGATRAVVTPAAMALARSADFPTPARSNVAAGPASATIPGARACETLRLALQPIQIAPLGVAMKIDQVAVEITSQPGLNERLGTLLCDVTTQLAGNGSPAELVTALNALLDMVG